MPVLYAQYTEQERISKVKKTYSTLKNAMTFQKAAGGEYIIEQVNNQKYMNEWFDTYLSPYLNTLKICYYESGCWVEDYVRTPDGSKYYAGARVGNDSRGMGNYGITAILNDGTLISIDDFTWGSSSGGITGTFYVKTNYSSILIIYFDINGQKKPNTMGKDVFVMVYTFDYGLVLPYSALPGQIDSNCSKSGSGNSCINIYLKK